MIEKIIELIKSNEVIDIQQGNTTLESRLVELCITESESLVSYVWFDEGEIVSESIELNQCKKMISDNSGYVTLIATV